MAGSDGRIVREWSTDCYACAGDLDDAEGLEAALRAGSVKVGATVLGASRTVYQPVGVTVFLPLAESHAMVSTWPEHRYAIVSILLCNDTMDPRVVLDSVLERLKPGCIRVQKLDHPVDAQAMA